MVQLTGNSLSERQLELNNKVNEAVASKINFDEVKAMAEESDVDRLFKIDIAAKYKNVEYIIDTLKSGDSLYVLRALKKCLWLYNDEYSNIINTENLHHNIFPFMSIKMKKKLLAALSVHLKTDTRIIEFYNYCSQAKMNDLAEKYLFNTPETFKLNIIKETKGSVSIKCIGNSFTLFEAFIQLDRYNKNGLLGEFSHLYSISDVQYLDLIEQHANIESYTKLTLGLRITKDIAIKHKDRILAKPKLYTTILNMQKLIRHSTLSDLKAYAVGVLPTTVAEFWSMEYYQKYKLFIDAIPESERFAFLKKIFTDNYADAEFEMARQFYEQNYHKLMTEAEKENWALRHINSGKEILGSGRDFYWYKFVNFEKAFEEIKKYVNTATDAQKRSELVKTLIRSAKTQRDVEQLLRYYSKRHVNEKKYTKESFLKKVCDVHNVFEFDHNCWEAFNKVLYSLDVYNTTNARCNPDFKIIAILYYIINGKEMHESLAKHIEHEISMHSMRNYIKRLSEEKRQSVYTYICDFYWDRIKNFQPGTEDQKCKAYIHFTLEFMVIYGKSKEDIPDAVMEYINKDTESFKYQQILETKKEKNLTESDLIQYLKKDSKLVVDHIPEVLDRIKHNWYFRLNTFLRKIKIYFSEHNVSQSYIKIFNDCLNQDDTSNQLAAAAVYAIFQLSDEKSKIELMNKFAPTNPKIDYTSIDRCVLRTQESICRFACYSRPPVPLSNYLKYLNGDYVHFCSPMFNVYLSILPQPECLKFVESVLDAPVSTQKHGIRLAFKCFNPQYLINLVLTTWKKTKNISLRAIIYEAFLDKTANEQSKEMYEALKVLTLDLHDDDKPELFSTILSKSHSKDFAGDFYEAVWVAVEKFKDNNENIDRKTNVVNNICREIHTMKKDVVKKIVSEYLDDMFSMQVTYRAAFKSVSLHLAKWNLVARYLIYFSAKEEDRSEGIETVKIFVGKLIKGWNDVSSDVYVYRQVCADLIKNLKNFQYKRHPTGPELIADTESYVNSVGIFEAILHMLKESLPLHEIYSFVWDLRVTIINREVVKEAKANEGCDTSAVKLGNRIGELVKEFSVNETYFSYFTEEIVRLISASAREMNHYLEKCVNTDEVLVGIARGLLEKETKETNLLALQVLPVEPNCDMDSYKSVYDAMQNIPGMEIKCCLHRKFSGDHKKRRYN